LPSISLALKRLNLIREKMTLLSKMQKLDDKSNSQLTLEMHMQ